MSQDLCSVDNKGGKVQGEWSSCDLTVKSSALMVEEFGHLSGSSAIFRNVAIIV